MKNFLFLLLCMASISFSAPVPGANMSSEVGPTDSLDTYSTHWAGWGRGGYRTCPDTIGHHFSRDSIPASRREIGMTVYCPSDSCTYQLVGGILNSNWKKLLGKTSSADWDSINFRAAHGKKVNLDGYNKGTSLTITQAPDTLQSGLNTGNSETLDSAWEAFRIVPDSTMTVYTIAIQMKRTGTITNNTAQCFGYLYSESGGKPGTKLAAGNAFPTQMFTTFTTSFVDKLYLVTTTSVALTGSTAYWVVLNTSTAPVGGTVQINSSATGTGQYAEGANGTSWTLKNGVTGWYRLYGNASSSISATTQNSGIISNSTNSSAITANCFGGNNTAANTATAFGGGNAYRGTSAHGTAGYFTTTDGLGVTGIANSAGGVGGSFTGYDNGIQAATLSYNSGKAFYAFGHLSASPTWDYFASRANAYNYFAGNVGIGDSMPTYKLQVKGNSKIDEVVVDTSLSVMYGRASFYAGCYSSLGALFGNDTKLQWTTLAAWDTSGNASILGSDTGMYFSHPSVFGFVLGNSPAFKLTQGIEDRNYAHLYNGNFYVDDSYGYSFGATGIASPSLTRGMGGDNGYVDIVAGGKRILRATQDSLIDSALGHYMPRLAAGVLGLDANKKIVNVTPASSDSARAAGKADSVLLAATHIGYGGANGKMKGDSCLTYSATNKRLTNTGPTVESRDSSSSATGSAVKRLVNSDGKQASFGLSGPTGAGSSPNTARVYAGTGVVNLNLCAGDGVSSVNICVGGQDTSNYSQVKIDSNKVEFRKNVFIKRKLNVNDSISTKVARVTDSLLVSSGPGFLTKISNSLITMEPAHHQGIFEIGFDADSTAKFGFRDGVNFYGLAMNYSLSGGNYGTASFNVPVAFDSVATLGGGINVGNVNTVTITTENEGHNQLTKAANPHPMFKLTGTGVFSAYVHFTGYSAGDIIYVYEGRLYSDYIFIHAGNEGNPEIQLKSHTCITLYCTGSDNFIVMGAIPKWPDDTTTWH